MKFFTLAALVGTSFAQDGTCTAGTDQIGVEQSCLGRCHIYSAGEYGACFNYQFQASDIDSPCGDSPSNACKSTFNQAWDNAKTNCGNCYYVEMPYPDGTVRSTYIKVVDTNASEVKFEMGQQAWRNLCPYVCAGTGDCGHTPESCQYGTLSLAGWSGFDSCAVQYAPIKFKRVDCESTGSDPTTTTTPAPLPTQPPVVIPPVTEPPVVIPPVTRPPVVIPPITEPSVVVPPLTEPPAVFPPITEPPVVIPPVTRPPVVIPPITEPSVVVPPITEPPMVIPPVTEAPVVIPPVVSEAPAVIPPVVTEPPMVIPPAVTEPPMVIPPAVTDPVVVYPPTEGAQSVPTACANAVGYPYIPDWNEECKSLCHFYYSADGRSHCPQGTNAESLIQCVLAKHPYCQRV